MMLDLSHVSSQVPSGMTIQKSSQCNERKKQYSNNIAKCEVYGS